MTGVRFIGVSKRFGNVAALQDLNLQIEAGEFVSLLGPSGSGKTTSLNLLAGLLPIDEGEIRIGDRRVNELPPDKRDIAMVFQSYALYPHMTVRENLAFPLRARRGQFSEAEIGAKVGRVAETLVISELLDRLPKELSGGQQQRVALGRAMVRDPKVFLLDEPLSNLDARLRVRMRHDIKALHQAIGSTIVYVTHDQAEAMSLSSRIAVFDKGRLQQFAPPREIYSEPMNFFVANFVGEREMTVLDGTIASSGNHAVFRGKDLELALEAGSRRFARAVGKRVRLGVRAEGIDIVPSGTAAGTPAQVVLSELAGPDQILYVTTASGAELCCRTAPSVSFAAGQTVHIRVASQLAFAFDAESGESVTDYRS